MEWNNKGKKTKLVRTSNASARRQICKTGPENRLSKNMRERLENLKEGQNLNMAKTNTKSNWGNENKLSRHWNTDIW